MKKEYIINTCCFIVGGMISFALLFNSANTHSKLQETFIYKGEINQMNISFHTEGTQFEVDSSVTKYANEFDGGIISTPQLANDIATAILEEHYTIECITKNRPFTISKDITTWNVNGMYQSKNKGFCFGSQLHISINRLNGMVTSMYQYNL